ncbi:hypothetical protein [Nioella sp.]|uniref:hypothetical protein n=1 Tax=Nioella sp. TaxID=1912091 RepID=UPI003A868DDC
MKTVSIIVVGNESVYQGLAPTQNARASLSSGEDVRFEVIHLSDSDRLERVVSGLPAEAIVLVTDTAEDAVARAIAAGTPPAQGMEDWIRVVSGVLAVQRRNRRSILLVAASAFALNPHGCCAEICQRFFTEKPDVEMVSETASPALAAWDAWHSVLASQTLVSSPGAQRFEQEFQAAALPVQRPTATPDAAFSEISGILESERALTEQNAQMVAANEELENLLSSERARLEADLLSRCTEISLLKSTLTSVQQELGDGHVALLKSKQAASRKLQTVQAESESQIKELSNEVSSLKGRIARFGADLEKANLAVLDAENRAAETIQRERKHAAECAEEQDAHRILLLNQLTNVQTELRDTVLKLNQAGMNEAKQIEGNNESLRREDEIEELRAAIRAFETSTSWAVTRPLRAIKTALSSNQRS